MGKQEIELVAISAGLWIEITNHLPVSTQYSQIPESNTAPPNNLSHTAPTSPTYLTQSFKTETKP